MRVLAVAHKPVGKGRHAWREIGVQVEDGEDRDLGGARQGPDPLQQVASGSSDFVVTMAPCRASQMPSMPAASAGAATASNARQNVSNTSWSSVPDGVACVSSVGITVQP